MWLVCGCCVTLQATVERSTWSILLRFPISVSVSLQKFFMHEIFVILSKRNHSDTCSKPIHLQEVSSCTLHQTWLDSSAFDGTDTAYELRRILATFPRNQLTFYLVEDGEYRAPTLAKEGMITAYRTCAYIFRETTAEAYLRHAWKTGVGPTLLMAKKNYRW